MVDGRALGGVGRVGRGVGGWGGIGREFRTWDVANEVVQQAYGSLQGKWVAVATGYGSGRAMVTSGLRQGQGMGWGEEGVYLDTSQVLVT